MDRGGSGTIYVAKMRTHTRSGILVAMKQVHLYERSADSEVWLKVSENGTVTGSELRSIQRDSIWRY